MVSLSARSWVIKLLRDVDLAIGRLQRLDGVVHTAIYLWPGDSSIAEPAIVAAFPIPCGYQAVLMAGPADTVDDIWARHEYTTISATVLSNKLAAIALSPEVRPRLIERTREYIRRGYPILDAWLESHEDIFNLVPAQAAAIAYVRYDLDVNSTELVERLLREKSVFIVPGDHFGMDRYLRISFGLPEDYLRAGLDRIHELMVELQG